jgi:LacI family transcriptional regulator
MPVTLEHIATQTGMSKATVSRALRNDRVIHPDTRSRVLEAAARAGYERTARKSARPSKKQPRVLFLLAPHSRESGYTVVNDYLRGMTRGVAELDCSFSVAEMAGANVGKLGERRRLSKEMIRWSADGVVVADRHNSEDVAALSRVLPVVSIQWEYPGSQIDLVSSVNYRGMAEMVRHLTEVGHRRLGWAGASYETSFFTDRKMGFIKGCMENGIEMEPASMTDQYEVFGANDALKKLVGKGVTCLVCANDFVARVVAGWALDAGLRVPEDLSIAGYDAVPEPIQNGKILTSYDPIYLEVGRTAVHAALRRIKDPGMPRITYLCSGRVRAGETVARLH